MSRIEELEQLLKKAQKAYYKGTPVMSDATYDALYDELSDLDPDNEALKSVGATPDDTVLKKAHHQIPMGSQRKVNTKEEFEKWVQKSGTNVFVIQPKLDGLSVNVIYENGKLRQAITRGDGKVGEDVTHTVRLMKNVPKKLPVNHSVSLRGEIIFRKSAFSDWTNSKKEKKLYANPRNAAAGLTRRKKPHEITREMEVRYFDVETDEVNFRKESHKIKYMINALGLKTVKTVVARNKDQVISLYQKYVAGKREKMDVEIDGLVLKVNSLKRQRLLGIVDGRPRGQVAWKFAAEKRETELEDVRWDVGLTGRITPVAVLRGVLIGGVTVRQASLHNVGNMKRLGVWKGASVLVSRRGDVIPYVEEVVEKAPAGAKVFSHPEYCPICGAKTEFEGEYLVCPSSICVAKQRGDIKKWIRVLDIQQLGDAFIDQALDEGIIKTVADLYTLKREEVAGLAGYGDRSADIIVSSVEEKKEVTLAQFFAGLNIPNAGIATFTAIEKAGYDSLDKILTLCASQLAVIPGIGDITAEQIIQGISNRFSIINSLLKNGVVIKEKPRGKLSGLSFCFTGELSIKRPVAQKFVESLGGEIKTSVSKGLDYLVQSDPHSNSGKAQKARKYGTQVIGEKEFMKMVDFSFKKMKELL